MKKGILIIVISMVMILTLVGCGSSPATTAKNISVEQAEGFYTSGKVFFLDVREVEEWNQLHIPGATLIPLGELPERLEELPKDQPIVVYCRSGNRSQTGRDILLNAGFSDVTSMDGGINDWYQNGYPVE